MAVKKTTKKKKAKKAASPDIRAHLEPTPANLKKTLENVRASLEAVPRPGEPTRGDLVNAMLHITFADGVPCGVGQECRRRLDNEYVDRNEFRLTEAYEIEQLLSDLEIPNLFTRCARARDSIAEIYNDRNDVTLGFLREASVTDRNMFFQRVPVMKPVVTHFIVAILTFEEILFSERSTLRLQQRMGLDPKSEPVAAFFGELKQLIHPYGLLPLDVGPVAADGRPHAEPKLCAASHVARLAPPPRGK